MSGVTPGPWRVKREHDPSLHRPGGRHGYTYAVLGTGDRPWVATGMSKANAHEIVRLHNEATGETS